MDSPEEDLNHKFSQQCDVSTTETGSQELLPTHQSKTEVPSEHNARAAPSVRPTYAKNVEPLTRKPLTCTPQYETPLTEMPLDSYATKFCVTPTDCDPRECASKKFVPIAISPNPSAPHMSSNGPCAVSPITQSNTVSVTSWASSASMIRENKDNGLYVRRFNSIFLTRLNEDTLILKERLTNKMNETLTAECENFWKTIGGTGYREEMEVENTPPTSE